MKLLYDAAEMFYNPLFWLLLFHGAFLLAAVIVAAVFRAWFTVPLVIVGWIVGAVLAVVPLWLLMEWSTARTGYDAGNAGVFFVCTVPTFPIIGMALGGYIGYLLEPEKWLRDMPE